MSPETATIGILLVGIVVVVGGVLALKLHAFLALILGAIAVSALTPAGFVQRSALGTSLTPVTSASDGAVFIANEAFPAAEPGTIRVTLVHEDPATGRLREVGRGVLTAAGVVGALSLEPAVDEAALARGGYAVDSAAFDAAEKLAAQPFIARVAAGFGRTCADIGILIAMASIIGKCLLDSGAADRIVRSMLRLLGERGAPAAFLFSGFLLGIPVFFDTVFYLMIPLGKAMRTRTGRNYLLYVLTIIAGATMAHSLVPPTPGPLFVAEQLNVPLGVMILAGSVVGLFAAGFGYLYAGVANRVWELPLRPSPDLSLERLEQIARRDLAQLPPTWLSLLPILLPVVLIGGSTVLDSYPQLILEPLRDPVLRAAKILGDKNLALILAAGIAMLLLLWQKRASRAELAEAVQQSLASGGVIILITAGGGAFGTVLQQTGVATLIGRVSQQQPVAVLGMAFLITMAVRTAQGSATVAMITAVGMLSGLASAETLGFHPVYLALAIGCGSKPIAWMNDSGFWVIGKMSGMTEGETLKYVTPMTAAMGFIGLGVVIIGAMIWPLV